VNDASLTVLGSILVLLIILSAFFSSSETGMMALNRYRLKHLSKEGHRGARRATRLLERTDQLIGVILIGNNFVNISASAIATLIAVRIWGDAGVVIATIGLTITILIFSRSPQDTGRAVPGTHCLSGLTYPGPLLKIFYPVVWVLNLITNNLLRLMGVKLKTAPARITSAVRSCAPWSMNPAPCCPAGTRIC